ncbi:MAG: glycine--tRNA ligase subunit beta [Bacillota bacterium]
MRDFLLEIGTEEIPARFLPGALEELSKKAASLLSEARLGFGAVETYGTPRRLVLFVRRVPERQEPLLQEVKGPARQAAYDAFGKPTKAAAGFARSRGVDVTELVVRKAGKTEYVFAVKQEPGKPAKEVLAELCPRLITSLGFPKPMRWGDTEMRFIRPIRWLTSLYGDEPVIFSIDELVSGRESRGHRFLAAGTVTIEKTGEYVSRMAESYVLVDPAERRRIVREQITALAAQEKCLMPSDDELLDEVVNLVEFPTAFCGGFPEEYLEIPEAVLVTAMREHQRYFPVHGTDGRLLPRFIAVHNSSPGHTAAICAGNEAVLRARLADAAFFYREDLATPLAKRIQGLKKVVYREELGTLYDKTLRLGMLVKYLGTALETGPEDMIAAARAAHLSKGDLLTNMVYEFPELQGTMGKEYALRDGESETVATALYEQYLPRFAGDLLPRTVPGRVLSIADKVDNLVGCFGLGLIPTGSQDPYALRRQALGLCHIVLDGALHVSLSDLILQACREYGGHRLKRDTGEILDELMEFFRQRLRGLFSEQDIVPEVTEAVLAAGFDDVETAWRRAKAVTDFRSGPLFGDLHTAYTRAANLARTAPEREPDTALFTDPAEGRLYQAVLRLREETAADMKDHSYGRVLEKLSALREPVDVFFDAVLVMDEDPGLRENRLALLRAVCGLVRRVADLSKIPLAMCVKDEGGTADTADVDKRRSGI